LPEEEVVGAQALPPPLARVADSLPLLEKTARDKAVEEVHKLPEDSEERLTEPDLRGQLVFYLLVEKVVRAICMGAEVEVVATSVEVEEVPILTAQEMMLEQAEVDPLSQILTTQQTLRISLESKAATEW
jgi:hypothetical protein